MPISSIAAPWTAPLSEPQHILIAYFLAIAGLALLVGFIRAWVTRGEVGSRYRPAVVARLGITGVAFLSYVFLIAQFGLTYAHEGDRWMPGPDAILTMAPRYMDWSITVPLLTVELLVMTTLVGAVLRRTMVVTMTGAFLMIFSGFVGAFVADGADESQAFLWGAISCVFWIFTTVVLIRAVRQSLPGLTWESAANLRTAAILLLSGWVIYPVLYIVPLFAFGGEWTTVIQVGLSVTDILIKIGFGTLIHRVAKLRTAEDVRAGDDVHHESIWTSSVKRSDAGSPREVFLADGASAHRRRAAPPTGAAVASEDPADH